MRRVIKKTNRKGFTLVETLLATFILVVISTMLINGFISTMGYSYQTSVYSKSGSNNYGACMDKVAEWNTLPDRGTDSRQKRLGDGASTQELKFKCPAGSKLESLSVETISKTTLDDTVPGTLPFKDAAYAPKNDDLVDNRKTIVYYPEYWWNGTNDSKYKIGIRINEETPGSTKYEWVVLPDYEVDDNKNLSGIKGNNVLCEVGTHKDYGKDNTKPTGDN